MKDNRSATDSELLQGKGEGQQTTSAVPQTPTATSIDTDFDSAPYRARLYQLFGLIEKEFDTLYEENCALRARIVALSEADVDVSTLQNDSFLLGSDAIKGSGGGSRKAIQMGQKLRTALRGPPGRLVFKVTDGSKFRMSRPFEGHRDGVWHVTADTQRGVIASSSADQTARIWSLDSGNCICTYYGHSGSVNCVSFRPVESSNHEILLATASGDESTHIWKTSSGTSVSNTVQQQQTTSSNEDEDEKENLETEVDKTIDDTKIKSPLLKLTGHTAPVVGCDWLPGSNQLISASWDRTANIYDVEKGDILNILTGHEAELNHCSAHSSQKLVVTSSKDSTFRLWDFRETIHSVAVFQGHQDSVTSVVFSSGDRLVSGSDDRTVKVWDLRNMRSAIANIRLSSAANRLACHSRLVSCCAWADDHPQHNLITCGFDRQVIGWKVAVSRDKEN
ncbi:hypothetical protein WR25_21859 [Diploscapter pachys]|uniref:WD repeat-containing protein 37 n=1 Tax=Diploscapter pachys TaxID=2018661 RepID=A0A2A2LCW7_9BILA|nr:hypothetical protein WR25_21859 [Diploscapter pachys]